MKNPILITGSRGFLARHLIGEIKRRDPAARLELWDRGSAPGHVRVDLEDRAHVARRLRKLKPRLIYHLAGSTRALGWDALWASHVGGTVSLLDSLKQLGQKGQVWIAGSSSEYGDAGSGALGENTPLAPVTLYGATKQAQCLAALSYRGQGVNVSVARIFNLVGPGLSAHLSLGSFCRQIARIEAGLEPPRLFVGNLSSRRDYVDVRDAASALAGLATLSNPEPVYHISSGVSYSLKSLLHDLLDMAKLPIAVISDPARLRAGDVRDCRGSHARITKAIGWRPRTPITQSLRDTLQTQRDGLA